MHVSIHTDSSANLLMTLDTSMRWQVNQAPFRNIFDTHQSCLLDPHR